MTALALALSAAIGYLIGCFSTGLTVSQERNIDIRSVGSKSTGATNVTRVMGARLGLVTFLGDFIKALLAVLAGRAIAGTHGGMLAGFFTVVGHNWPVFYRFRGGKGIACSMAVLLMLFPSWALISFACAAVIVLWTRIVALGSLTLLFICAAAVPFTQGWWPDGVLALSLFLLGLFRHRENIRRMRAGTENRFTFPPKDRVS